MAQTISHEAEVQVKDEQNKAALVTLLSRTYDQINDLQGQLDALTERIDPAPAPLPDTVNPYRLRNHPHCMRGALTWTRLPRTCGRP